jgi:Protein of unknown function (DUF2490)
MFRKSALMILLFGSVSVVFSQKPDFGMWYSVSVEHKFFKKFEFDLSGDIRTIDNASKIREDFIEGQLSFKIIKHITVAGGYRPEYHLDKDDNYHWRNVWFAEVKGTLPIGRLSLSARFRFEDRYKTYFLDRNDEVPVAHGRYRFKAFYNIRKFPVSPYIEAEFYSPMFRKSIQNPERSINKKKFTCGLEYYFAKKQSLEFEYIYQVDYFPGLTKINILSLNYTLKF